MNLELTPKEVELILKVREEKEKETRLRQEQADFLQIAIDILRSDTPITIGEIEKYVRQNNIKFDGRSETYIVSGLFEIIENAKETVN